MRSASRAALLVALTLCQVTGAALLDLPVRVRLAPANTWPPALPDTILWYAYADTSLPYWVTARGPERAVRFVPADFFVFDAVELLRVRAGFHEHEEFPWPDSSFVFRVYDGRGDSVLYESPELEAEPGWLTWVEHELTEPVRIEVGDSFVVAVAGLEVGYPSSVGDSLTEGQSFFGRPDSWQAWNNGELFVLASFQAVEAVTEPEPARILGTGLSLVPNPTDGPTVVRWSGGRGGKVEITVADVVGAVRRRLQVVDAGQVWLDLGGLARGVYLVRVEAPSGTSRGLVVVR